jgi:hypothetical protein
MLSLLSCLTPFNSKRNIAYASVEKLFSLFTGKKWFAGNNKK